MRFGPLAKIESSSPLAEQKTRRRVLSLLMLAALGVILARLFELTVIFGSQNRLRADQNRIVIRPISAPRGVILDRGGEPLTRNIPSKKMVDFPGDDLGPILIESPARYYPFGDALAHVVGYAGEISQEELDHCRQKPDCPLESGDIVGKTGLEKEYDSVLRGTDGARLIEVDAGGRLIRVIGEQPPVSGRDIRVNLDLALQRTMAEKLAGRPGAAVAIDPLDGAVIGLVSSPGFDPNLFSSERAASSQEAVEKEVAALLADTTDRPLFNRAVSGAYPPGSIFKLVTASAALSSNKVTKDTVVEDTGEIRIGSFRFGNWYFDQYGKTEGAIGLVRAIARSNDIFFYRAGEWAGPEKISQWAKTLGLGAVSGIDLPGEADGLVPDPRWKEKQSGERWYLGNTYHLAIGQGDVRITPLQAAAMAAAVITGQECRPHILQQGADLSFCRDTAVSAENRQLILSGMVGACSAGGTAFPFFSWNEHSLSSSAEAVKEALPIVACKTGTAQHGGKETKPHAWIITAGPIKHLTPDSDPESISNSYQLDLDSPQRIVLVVLVEESGEGSYIAAPIAKEILAEWFKNKF